jgi:glycosyltransferase involved in cell wall biosynthesis
LRPLVRRLYIAALRPAFDRILDKARPQVVVTCSCSLIYFNETLEQSAREHAAFFAIVPMCHIETGENTGPRFISLFRRAGAALASTQHEASWLRAHGVPQSTTHVLGASADYVVADIAESSGNAGLEPSAAPNLILFLGRKARSKGYQLILGAMAAVWAEFPETQFAFVGPGETDWRNDSAPFLSDARVHDIGAVDAERAAWLKRCAILCVPSVAESFGLIYTEAWLFHKPVIAADIAVTRETVGLTGGGLIVEPTIDGVARGIAELLRNPARAREMGEQGWRATREKYNWANIAGALDRIADQAQGT